MEYRPGRRFAVDFVELEPKPEASVADKAIPYHLRYADIVAHQSELASRRTVPTHLSADMLGQLDDIRRLDESGLEIAHDGLALQA